MQYNTSKGELQMPEYGRHVQNLVNYAKTIEDNTKQQQVVAGILDVMATINPNTKNLADYEHRLWDHLFIISNFQLECESPFPKPMPEEVFAKPEKFTYPLSNVKHLHYGKLITQMIKKASLMEDEEKQEAYTELIATYMKRTYEDFSSEGINDDIIKEDLARISKGELTLDEEQRIFVKRKRNNNNNNPKRKKANPNYRRRKRN